MKYKIDAPRLDHDRWKAFDLEEKVRNKASIFHENQRHTLKMISI
jgi:hypothetical protein